MKNLTELGIYEVEQDTKLEVNKGTYKSFTGNTKILNATHGLFIDVDSAAFDYDYDDVMDVAGVKWFPVLKNQENFKRLFDAKLTKKIPII